jgi:hypothetical protein
LEIPLGKLDGLVVGGTSLFQRIKVLAKELDFADRVWFAIYCPDSPSVKVLKSLRDEKKSPENLV